jgi:hypothetical protein
MVTLMPGAFNKVKALLSAAEVLIKFLCPTALYDYIL